MGSLLDNAAANRVVAAYTRRLRSGLRAAMFS